MNVNRILKIRTYEKGMRRVMRNELSNGTALKF